MRIWAGGALLIVTLIVLPGCEPPAEYRVASSSERQTKVRVNPSAWPKVQSPLDKDLALESRINALLAQMSIEEKVGQMMQAEIQSLAPGDIKKYHLGSVLNGGGSWPQRKSRATVADWLALADRFYQESMDTSDGKIAVPIIWGTDAVHGHNNVLGATLFPHNIGLGATRNSQLVTEIGAATARVVRATGIDWVFAPTVAVARNDAWGRTYESYSESPDLVAELAAAMVRGLQGEAGSQHFLASDRVVATAKHFVGDGATWRGDDQGDARIPESAMIGIHNVGYPPAIASGVQTVMASFNSWYGVKMHGNHDLLTRVLKQRMGFDGLVVGDWNGHGQVAGCSNVSCAQAINAGIDLLMVPTDWKALLRNTLAQVANGEISETRIDDAVRRILRVKIRAGLFDSKPSVRAPYAEVIGSEAHRNLARQAVRESLVLLKNRNKLLPLAPQQHILVAGAAADSIAQQSGGWSLTWQGTGNRNNQFPGATSILAGVRAAVTSAGGTVSYSASGEFQQKPDVAIFVFGEMPYAEGNGDRDSLEFQVGNKAAHSKLKRLRDAGIPVVAVFLSGRAMWVNPELNASDAFVAAWLPGSEGAGIADVIIAGHDGQPRYDFTGRLAFSWPAEPLDTDLNIGTTPYAPLFPFGYGLDYSMDGEGPADNLPETTVGVADADAPQLALYVRRPMQPWNVFIENGPQREMLSGAHAALSDGSVQLTTSDKGLQEDALTLQWQGAQAAQLALRGSVPLNLESFTPQGTLLFDIHVKDLAEGAITVAQSCGANCLSKVPLTNELRGRDNSQWHSIALPLRCFGGDAAARRAVALPFVLQLGGSGEIALANIRFDVAEVATMLCPSGE